MYLKGTSGEIKTQNFKKVRFLRYCYKNSKIFFLQQLFSIVKIMMPLRLPRSSIRWNLLTGLHSYWSRMLVKENTPAPLLYPSAFIYQGTLFSLICGTSGDEGLFVNFTLKRGGVAFKNERIAFCVLISPEVSFKEWFTLNMTINLINHLNIVQMIY